MIDFQDYSDNYTAQYKNQSFETILVQVRRQQVLSSLQKYPHHRILEIGCGLEPLFPFCSSFKHFTVVEPSVAFAQHAAELAQGRANVNVIHGTFEDVYQEMIESANFDFIVLSSLLHEVVDPAALLRTIHAVCNESTVTHINVPNVYSFHRLLAYEMGIVKSIFEPSATEQKFQRHTRYNQEQLFKTIATHGFKVLSSGSYFVKPFTHEQMEKILQTGIIDSAVITGLEKMTKYMPDLGCEIFANVQKEKEESLN
ncbi:MAG: methyltransferase domain-containing protein [Abitibacteriaceae bacterium]|nr:methyltransferase domain-containing protein [Abditibacteriaceae bacterium]